MAAPKLYHKLPGRGIRRAIFAVGATRCRLWLGPDHLLAVDATTASEEYRRFYFRDIEAFVIRQTRGRMKSNLVLLALTLICAGPLLYFWRTEGSTGWLTAAIASGAFWLGLALVNTLRGATCETKIRTAVHLEHLPSLSRLPLARKVLARILPIITEAQGAATSEELATAPWMAPDAARHLLKHDKGTIHYALFAVLLADAISTLVANAVFHAASSPAVAISTAATVSGFLLCIFALMRQSNSDLPTAARLVTRGAFGLYILSFGASFVFSVIFAASHPGKQGHEIMTEPGFQMISMISAGLCAVVGLAGFAAMRGPRRSEATA